MEYKVFKHSVSIDGVHKYSYGIIVTNNDKILDKYYDISLEKQKVQTLVNNLNRYEVELIHVKDIIYDFYAENYWK